MTEYPTKKEILDSKPKTNNETITAMLIWKKDCLKGWNKLTNNQKIFKLEFLIEILNDINEGDNLKVKIGNEYCYDNENKIIYQKLESPSIISALHELAHHLFGPEELKACSWSIYHFALIFPIQYSKLKWKGHLLVKK